MCLLADNGHTSCDFSYQQIFLQSNSIIPLQM